jgi:hypothetical protein
MKPARDDLHQAARLTLSGTAVFGVVLLIIARWWDPLGQPAWLMTVGQFVAGFTAVLAAVTLILYGVISIRWFATWLTRDDAV